MFRIDTINGKPAIVDSKRKRYVPLPQRYRLILDGQNISGAVDLDTGKPTDFAEWLPLEGEDLIREWNRQRLALRCKTEKSWQMLLSANALRQFLPDAEDIEVFFPFRVSSQRSPKADF